MGYKLVLRDDAVADEAEAYAYYEDEQVGLGESFFQDLEFTYAAILRNPYAFGYAANSTVRKVALQLFRYLVFYQIFGDEVVVFRVFHTSQKPLF